MSEEADALAWMNPTDIPRLPCDSPKAVARMAANLPVVLTGCPLTAALTGKWTPAYLAEAASPAAKFKTFRSDGEFLFSNPDKNAGGWKWQSPAESLQLSLADFYRRMCELQAAERSAAGDREAAAAAGSRSEESKSELAADGDAASDAKLPDGGASDEGKEASEAEGSAPAADGDAEATSDADALSAAARATEPVSYAGSHATSPPLHPCERMYLQQPLAMDAGSAITTDYGKIDLAWAVAQQRAFGWGELTTMFMLIGQRGIVTPVHYDEQQNLFCQLSGRKVFHLFPPSAFPAMAPFPVGHPADRQGQVRLTAPDLDRFPALASLRAQRAVLNEGDVLFLPQMWWHHVQAPWEATVSLAFWFKCGRTPPPTTDSSGAPVLSDGLLLTVRRNVEKLLGGQFGFPRSAHAFAALAAAGEEGEVDGDARVVIAAATALLVQLLPKAMVMPFLRETAGKRFQLELPSVK